MENGDVWLGTRTQRRYQTSGFHPLDKSIHPPALDVRHARAIFILLSFRKRGENTQFSRFPFFLSIKISARNQQWPQ